MANLPEDHMLDSLSSYMKELTKRESDSTFRDMMLGEFQPASIATEIKMLEEERKRAIYGGRSNAKSTYLGAYQKALYTGLGTVSGRRSGFPAPHNLRPSRTTQVSVPTGLFQGKSGTVLIMDDLAKPSPTNTKQDREFLNLSIAEYQSFAVAIQSACYLNREGHHCKVKNAKMKKLKNLRHKITKSDYLMKSMIWKAQLHVIEAEINKRQKISRGQFS